MNAYETNTTLKDVRLFAHFLREKVYEFVSPLSIEIAVCDEPVPFQERLNLEYRKYAVGDKWSKKLFNCGWMHVTGAVQDIKSNRERAVYIDVSGEGCLFDAVGTPVRGLTNVSSQFDRNCGLPGKTVLFLDEMDIQDGAIDAWIEIGDNDLFGASTGGIINNCSTIYVNYELRQLFYDFAFLIDYLDGIDDGNPQYFAILRTLERAAAVVSSEYTDEEIARARKIIAEQLSKKNAAETFLTFSAIGHAHLDLAWLWPIRETRRKLGRTFANVNANMDRYPDFLFGASQAQQFEWLEESYPELFEKIAKKIRDGRIEIQGGMWVEADANLSGGEALIRQMLYGKRYFKQKFGVDVKVCWLPDAFGFSGVLPQLIKKCGMDYFLTIKLSWAEHFKYPHHTFVWQGIDGSEVICHMPPEGNYNSSASPKTLLETQANFVERGQLDSAMILYGIGDGGGGPGRDHIERVGRAKDFLGLPKVKQQFAEDYFKGIEKKRGELARWQGELYLDRHQGTLTSVSETKRFNRLMETALANTEKFNVIAKYHYGATYRQADLERIWKEMLLYQFHDILPGSAIKRVYDENFVRYRAMLSELADMRACLEKQGAGSGVAVFNPHSFAVKDTFEKDGKLYAVEAKPLAVTPAKPTKKIAAVLADEHSLENEYLSVSLNVDGSIASVFDKTGSGESLKCGNRLRVYNEFLDCWDMTPSFKKYQAGSFKLVSASMERGANFAAIVQKYTYGKSALTEKLILKSGSRYLEIAAELDWQESKKMLRAEFTPLKMYDVAVCDVQFGSVERPTYTNTVRDFGMYEVSMHKYVDVSGFDGGVAILNDCKYACNVKDGEISINLLRSQTYPCEHSDVGKHEFRYAVYPHAGDSYSSEVKRMAELFNNPLEVVSCRETNSFFTVDSDDVIVESIKKSEDGEEIVARLYETRKRCAQVALHVNAQSLVETDMLENADGKNLLKDGCANLSFTPFEIKTIKIRI